jgi:CheY-like chemotaxis protein
MDESIAPLSVLVVDDCHDTADSTSQIVELCGHHSMVAFNVDEALALAAAEPPDVVLLDVHLPKIDGDEVARCLRGRRTAKPPLMIAISGSNLEADRNKMKEAGCHLYLLKPVDPSILIGLMRRVQRALSEHTPAPETDFVPATA